MTPLLATALAGLISGFLNALAGGGSLVLFPTLVGLGLSSLEANVSNSLANWPGYLGGLWGFAPHLQGQRDRLLPLGVLMALGTLVGTTLLLVLPNRLFEMVVPCLLLLASGLLAAQPYLVGSPLLRGKFWIFAAGCYGGYFGGGLGVILLATLGASVEDSLHRLNALKGTLSLICGSCSLLVFLALAPIHWPAVVVAGPASLLGGYGGARLASKIPLRPLRWLIVVYGLLLSLIFAYRL